MTKVLIAAHVLNLGLCVLSAQQPAIFTATQAERGRIASERSCSQCHTVTLRGRKGEPGEVPAVQVLSEEYQQFIGPRGTAPPLVGPVFLSRWGGVSAAKLIGRFQETVDSFRLQEDQETTVNITAYILQMNGARAGGEPLTRATDVVVNSTIPRP